MPRTDRSTALVAMSTAWCAYFRDNGSKSWDLPWDDAYQLTKTERRAIEKSVQQFQLGEGAEGRRLLARGHAHARVTADGLFPEALTLFIREEQRHSAQLLRFMRLQGIPAVEKHWVDSVFRWVRVLAGLELELRVLVTAEVIAVPYYRALGRATRSVLLRSISDRILQDEAEHLRFQASTFSRLEVGRSRFVRRLVWQAHRWFLAGTCCVVWIEHRSVFNSAGHSFRELVRGAMAGFSALETATASGACAPPRADSHRGDDSGRCDLVSSHRSSPATTARAEVSASQLR